MTKMKYLNKEQSEKIFREGFIKYDLILHPNADLNKINIEYLGTDGIFVKDEKHQF